MMKLLSILVFVVLSVIAAIHAYWAFGGLWPAQSEAALIKTVIGDPAFSRMPSQEMTLVVAALIATAGLIALMAGDVVNIAPRWFARLGAGVLAFVFLARGIAGYAVKFTDARLTEPFATYDVLYYSPLCLLVGAIFVLLVIKRPKL